MLIAQITDLHVTAHGTKAFGMVDTNAHLAAAVDYLNRLDPPPDLVLITGDLANTPEPAEYAALAELLAPLALPCRAIPGNHDDRAGLRTTFGPRGWVPLQGDFLHQTADDGPLRIILLDTQEPGRIEGRLCERRLAWLAERLAEAPDRPTLLAMHHPPFRTGLEGMDRIRCFGTEGLADLLAGHRNVLGIVCGHVHRPVTVGWGGVVAFAAPSTAHQIAIDLRAHAPYRWTAEPPAVALHRWTPDDGLVTHLSFIGPEFAPRRFP